ncbi:MAG: CoA-binding protein [Cryomorphaceae bacterium]|nr:MAG: CoA-binding protein [Cryomorphaceae bacterium]
MKTLVLGASPNPQRYAYMAVKRLLANGYEVVAVGKRPGEIDGVPIQTHFPHVEGVHTISLYVGARYQPELYDYIRSIRPRRVIFNPGTENPEFQHQLEKEGIHAEHACTLVMLSAGTYGEPG